MSEKQNIEYKQSWHDDYLKWVCGLTLEELKIEHNSRPRNPKITDACFMAGYIDTWGRGTLKIINACKEAGLPEPEIKEMNGGIEVTIYSQIINDETGGTIGGTIGGAIGGAIEDLTDRQRAVLELIKGDNKLSVRKLAEKLDINVSAAQGHFDILKEKGIIERIGGTRGYWKVIIEL